jgi:hypothetical protein
MSLFLQVAAQVELKRGGVTVETKDDYVYNVNILDACGTDTINFDTPITDFVYDITVGPQAAITKNPTPQ